MTLIKYSKSNSPAIDISFFPNTPSSLYWTSTTYDFTKTNAWTVDFTSGSTSGTLKSNNSNVNTRCVTGP